MENNYQKMEKWGNNNTHLQKQRGAKECDSYRPISLLQITYKIWSNLIAQRLAKIIHILTSNNQYGYKANFSTIDAILKIEQYIDQNNDTQNILQMDLAKAFCAISRNIPWATLQKKGLPIQMILHIKRGHNMTTLQAKRNKNMEKNRKQHRSIPGVSYKCDDLHYLSTRHDGGASMQ